MPDPGESSRPAAPRRRRRRILIVAGAVLLVLVVLVALVPTIAGSMAPRRVEAAINKSINGKATVDGASFSWFGGQRIGPVTIADAHGNQVAVVTLEAERGLLGLARAGLGWGPMNLGVARVSGEATLYRYADGAAAPEPPKPGTPPRQPPPAAEPVSLPRGLTATLILDNLDLRVVDVEQVKAGAPAAVARVPALKGTVSITDATAAAADVGGELFYGPRPDSPSRPGGRVAIVATADSLTDSAGRLTPDLARVDAKVVATDAAVVIADSLARMEGRLVEGLGDRMRATVTVNGTMANADAAITAAAPGLDADIALKSTDGVLTAPRPGTVRLAGDAIVPLVPGLRETLEKSDRVRLERAPEVRLVLDRLRLGLPTGGGSLDLRGAEVGMALQTAEAAGQVAVPGPGGEPGALRPFTVAPASLRLDSADLTREVTLKGGTSATLAGQPAGTLDVDMAAGQPLDASGGVRAGVAERLRGRAALTGVATAIAQPFAEAAGVDLARDVGPQLDLSLVAAQPEAGGPSRITAQVASENINGAAALLVDPRTIRTAPEGVDLRIGTIGPIATRALRDAGVTVESGGSVALTASDAAVDLDRLRAAGGGTDLRAFSGVVRVQAGQMAGRLARAGEPVRTWQLAPLNATINARDLASGASVKASTSATLDGEPAVTIGVDLAATGLVGPGGAPAAGLPAINGRVAVSGVSTRIAQPWVEAAGLDLPAGVGPKMDVVLTAASRGGATGAAGGFPETDLDLSIRSAGVSGTAPLTLAGRTVRARGQTELSIRSPGTLAGGAARQRGLALSEGGSIRATTRDLAIEFDRDWRPVLGRSVADVELTVGGFSIGPAAEPAEAGAPAPAPAAPVALNQMTAAAKLAPGRDPSVSFRGSASHGGAAFFSQGEMAFPGLIGDGGALTPGTVRPVGSIEINNLPTTLATLVAPSRPAAPGERAGLDLARLLRDAAGPTMSVTLNSRPPRGGDAAARDIDLRVQSPGVNGQAAATVNGTSLAVQTVDFRARVSPELAATLIDAAGPGLASRPALAGPAMVTLSVSPVTIPLKGVAPDFTGAGDALLRVGLEGLTQVSNVVVAGDGGQPRDIGPIGLRDILLTASVPMGSLAKDGPAKPAEARLTGAILGADQRPVAAVEGGGRVVLAAGGPAGNLDATLKLNIQDAGWFDTFMGDPGLVSGAVGPTAELNSAATVEFTPGSFAYSRVVLSSSLNSPRMATMQGLKAAVTPGSVALQAPMVLSWAIDPAWANRYLRPSDPRQGGDILRLAAPTRATLSVFRLALSTAPGSGLMAPGKFEADAEFAAPRSDITVGPADRAVRTTLQNLRARFAGGREPGTLGFSLSIDDAGGGRGPSGKPAVTAGGGLYGVSDAAGNPTLGQARLTATGAAYAVPTVLVDSLANQQGLLIEAIGPTSNLEFKTQGLSRSAGTFEIAATSPRIDARISGNMQTGTVVLPGTQRLAALKVVTPEFGEMLTAGLPQLATIEKRPEDGPATVSVTDLRAPIDGDWSKLNGTIVLDLAQARLQVSSMFGQLLKLAGQQANSTVGRRLEPIRVVAQNGVLRYDRVTIPLGEFMLQTSGAVDLVNRQVDVVTYVPFGALSDEAAGLLGNDIGRLLGGRLAIDQATMVPIRTTGPFSNTQTKPDLEMFAKEAGRTLLGSPEKVIGGGLQDLLDKLGNGNKKRPDR